MEITVSKKELLRSMARMQGIAERRSTMPILSNVLFTTEGGTLRLSATDLYLSISETLTTEHLTQGSFAVSARDLYDRLKMMPEGLLQIHTQDNASVMIKTQGSARRYTLRGFPGEDFPSLPSPEKGSSSLHLGVDALYELITKTYFSISTDESRSHLNAALFESDGEKIRMVSTDGHRLSKIEIDLPGGDQVASMLIPLKAIHELRRLCEDTLSERGKEKDSSKKSFRVVHSGPNSFFETGSILFGVKLIDAQFPPYGQVIPQHTENNIRVPRSLFAESMRAVSLAANERTGGVKLNFSEGSLHISTESPESGEGFDEIPIEYTGPSFVIGFNARYFLDVVNALDEEEIELCLGGELDPVVVRPIGPRNFLGVIMPMRTG